MMKCSISNHRFKQIGCSAMALIFCLGMILAAVPQAAAAMIPNVSRSSPIKVYPLKTSGRLQVYSNAACTKYTSKEYIDASTDECRILAYDAKNQSFLVSYPAGKSTKERYVPVKDFTSMAGALSSAAVKIQAEKTITTYKRASTSATYGSISKGDAIYILETAGAFTHVVYPLDSGGGYKMAWVLNTDLSYVANGTYTLASALNRNYVVDISGANPGSMVNVQVYTRNGTPAQDLTFSHVGNGWYKITNAWGKVLDARGGVRGQTTVWTYDWNGSDAQLWMVFKNSDGSYYLKNKLGCFMDVSTGNARNGQDVQVYPFNATLAQKFYLEKAGSTTSSNTNVAAGSYARYSGVDYHQQTSDARRIAACEKAEDMSTILWKATCSFPTWKSSGGTYNRVTATDGTSATQFIAGKTYQGIPYSMAGRTYTDVEWAKLVGNGLSTSTMTGKYYTSRADTTAKGIDCSYLVCAALNKGCGTSINLNTKSMLSSSKFTKISLSQMLPGDIFLKNGHVMFYMGKTANGKYGVVEANADYSRVVYRDLSGSSLRSFGCYRYTGFR